MRRMTLTICLLASCILCFALVSRSDSSQVSAGGAMYKPVASVPGLMHGQLLIFKTVGKAVEDKNTPHRGEMIQGLSEALAELANVNILNGKKDDYRGWAAELRDTAMELSKEAKKETPDDGAMTKLVSQLKATCTSCHDAYQ